MGAQDRFDDLPQHHERLRQMMLAASRMAINALAPILHACTAECGIVGSVKVLAAASRQLVIEAAGAVRQTVKQEEIDADDVLFTALYFAAEEEHCDAVGNHRSINPFFRAHEWFEKIRGRPYDRGLGPWEREHVMEVVAEADAGQDAHKKSLN